MFFPVDCLLYINSHLANIYCLANVFSCCSFQPFCPQGLSSYRLQYGRFTALKNTSDYEPWMQTIYVTVIIFLYHVIALPMGYLAFITLYQFLILEGMLHFGNNCRDGFANVVVLSLSKQDEGVRLRKVAMTDSTSSPSSSAPSRSRQMEAARPLAGLPSYAVILAILILGILIGKFLL